MDLFILSSVCVRQRLNVQHLAVLTLLYRRGQLYVSEVVLYGGLCKSKAYDSLHYLGSKGLAVRELVSNKYKSAYVWSLTREGRRLVREYEVCYKKLRAWLFRRW